MSIRIPLSLLVLAGTISGCGGGAAGLPNRVAVIVTVKIGNQLAGDGSLALRPAPGVKCPLIKIPVVNGIGEMAADVGPVPGDYQATFRPVGSPGDITQKLSESGRSLPNSKGKAAIPTKTAGGQPTMVLPKRSIPLKVPNQPASTIDAVFEAA